MPRILAMPIEVVRIAQSHAAGFHACLDAIAREGRFLAQIEAQPLEKMEAFVRENIEHNAAQYVALDGATVVGWCDVFPAWPEAIKHCGALGMGVLAAYRSRGIGKQLLAATLAHARRNGITRIELEVRADNLDAIKLYERVGFVHEGRKRNSMRFNGTYFDSLAMALVYEEI
jgi:ribosomal protein S18 acetylase RimI-like enzyme